MKRFVTIITALLIVEMAAAGVVATFDSGQFRFTTAEDNTARVDGPATGVTLSGSITLPSKVVSTVDGQGYTVESVGFYAFQNSSITAVNFPSTIKYIYAGAFMNCQQLRSVNITASMMSVGEWAFSGCKSVTSLTFATGTKLYYLAEGSFAGMTSLTTVDMSACTRVEQIEASIFRGCDALKSITLPAGLTAMGASCFGGCHLLESITIPAGVTAIPDYCFQQCTGLTSITFASDTNLKSVGEFAFSECANLPSLQLPSSVESIGALAFQSCKAFTEFALPQSLTVIGNQAFKSCTALEKVTSPNGRTLQSMGDGAFSYCSSLKQIPLFTGITEIPDNAFFMCKALVYPSVQPNVQRIGAQAYYGCSSLITVGGTGVTEIGESAFEGCTALTVASLPLGVTALPDRLFHSCTNLKQVVLPKHLTSIGKQALANTALTSVVIPDYVTTIGDEAFVACTELADVTLPASLTTLGNGVFPTTKLSSFTIKAPQPPAIEAGKLPLQNLYGTAITLHCPSPAINSYINDEVWGQFATITPDADNFLDGLVWALDESEMTAVLTDQYLPYEVVEFTMPDFVEAYDQTFAVTEIGARAFSALHHLERVDIGPATVIGNYAFQNCEALRQVNFRDVESIGWLAFSTSGGVVMDWLTELDLPATLTSVGSRTFQGATALTKVTVRASEVPGAVANSFVNSTYSTATLYVPQEAIEQYRSHAAWGLFARIEAIPTRIRGDVNGDGSVDGNDVSALLEMALAGGVSAEQAIVADVNGDGSVDGNDVSALLEMALAGE